MKRKIITYLSLLLPCLCACEHELPFDRTSDHAVLSMTGLLSTTDSVHTLYVSYSTAEEVLRIPDPKLYCYVNDRLVSESDEVTDYKMKFTAHFQAGDRVRLALSASDGLAVAEVEEQIPLPAEITHVELNSVWAKRAMDFMSYEAFTQLLITMKDRPGERNFYFPSLATSYTKVLHLKEPWSDEKWETVDAQHDLTLIADYNDFILNEGMVQVDTGDEIFGSIIPNTYIAFTDALFADAEGTISVFTDPSQLLPWCHSDLIPNGYSSGWKLSSTNRKLYVRIHSISEAYYLYLRALNTLDSGNYEPVLSDPVSLPSNVRGGVGFVGFSSAATHVIELEDEAEAEANYYW